MSAAGRLAGALGAVFLLTTPFTWWLSGELGPFVLGKLLLAAAALAFFLSTNSHVLRQGIAGRGQRVIGFASVVVVCAIAVALNVVAWQRPFEFDVTGTRIYTLSDQTLKVLKRLDKDATLYGFFPTTAPNYVQIEETLARFARESDRLRYEMVAPENRPDLVKRFSVTESGPRIVVAAGNREAKARNIDEQELTNALIRATQQIQKTIGFLRGHGELDFDDDASAEGASVIRQLVAAEGFSTRSLSLLEGRAVVPGTALGESAVLPAVRVPPDIKVLVVAGPQAELPGPELLALEEFLGRGGRLMVMLEPTTRTGLGDFIRPWKIAVGDDFVIDSNPMSRAMGLGAASPQIFATDEGHPITDAMVTSAIFATARSVRVLAGGEIGVEARTLLRAGESAWGETAYESGAAGFDGEDTQPPVYVAALATRSTTTVGSAPEGRLLVFGDSDWINNRNQSLRANADVFINSINFLAEEEDRISIRPRTRAASSILLTGRQMSGLRIITLDLIPALLVAFGFGVVTVRRRR